jgi:hypothetical protein
MMLAQSSRDKPNWTIWIAVLCFVFALFFYGRHLDFSGYAHPDEPNKINQIIRNEYNFHHPMMMIRSIHLTTNWLAKSSDFEFVKVAGRWGGVICASISVALFVLINGRLYGRFIAVATAIFVLSNPHLFDLAHYFKEDPWLLFGISFTLLAMLVHSESRGTLSAGLLGFSASLAISAKYSAVLVLPFVFYILFSSSIHKKRDFWACFLCLILGVVAINFPALEALTKVSSSFGHEIASLSGESKIASRRVPHGVYSNVYWQSSTPVLIFLLAVYGITLCRKGWKITPFEWVILLFPLVYIAVLSFLPKTHHRYFLPVAVMLASLSAAGLQGILRLKHGRWIASGLILLSVAWQCPRLLLADRGFSQDFKTEALLFLETKLPVTAIVLEDKNVNLPASPRLLKRRLAPSDTLEGLRADGITHVIVSSRQYGGLFLESSRPKKGGEENFLKMRALYEHLFDEGQLLKEWETGGNIYLAPPLRIYSIELGPHGAPTGTAR